MSISLPIFHFFMSYFYIHCLFAFQMDGGSDWLALYHTFVEYVTASERNQLLAGLDKIYQYTLLPAEVYYFIRFYK